MHNASNYGSFSVKSLLELFLDFSENSSNGISKRERNEKRNRSVIDMCSKPSFTADWVKCSFIALCDYDEQSDKGVETSN